MGQYYFGTILNKKRGNKQSVKNFFDSWDYGNGSKLMEHSYIGNYYVNAVMNYLLNNGKQYVLWAGDYADEEPKSDKNIYDICQNSTKKKLSEYRTKSPSIRFIINHTKREFVDLKKMKADKIYGFKVNPLPLLCNESNERGGGDYYGKNKNLCGKWARNLISASDINPSIRDKRYKEIEPDFKEE